MARPDNLNSSGTADDTLIPGCVFPINPGTHASGLGRGTVLFDVWILRKCLQTIHMAHLFQESDDNALFLGVAEN